MIKISLDDVKGFNEQTSEFTTIAKGGTFSFEFSLKALSEWESKYRKPFLNAESKTVKESSDFLSMCAIGKRPDPDLFIYGNGEQVKQLWSYIEIVPSATVIENESSESNGEIPTSEVLYAMLAMAGMDYSCDNWNLNRLIMTLRVIAAKNQPEKKMSKRDTMLSNTEINERRKRLLGTKG